KPANYDRSATQFSPSGRLLQAEYALTASKRYINNEEQYFDTSISNSSNFTASSSSQITISAVTNGKSSCIVRVLPREAHQTPVKHASNVVRVSSLTPSALFFSPTIGTKGLSSPEADSLFLKSVLIDSINQHLLKYGAFPSASEIAAVGDELSHELTLSPGLRPLGVEGVIVGAESIYVVNAMQSRGGVWGVVRGGKEGMKSGEEILMQQIKNMSTFDVIDAAWSSLSSSLDHTKECELIFIKAPRRSPMADDFADPDQQEKSIFTMSKVTPQNFPQAKQSLLELIKF
ncbi:hypothetical protein ScalyP_jg8398, partial [Parmales sp. scaly parma]